MKQFGIIVVAALLVIAFSVPAMAKVNLAGAMWTTYWAQKQSHSLRSTDGANMDAYNVNQVASPKTFMVAQQMNGNGLQAHGAGGYGFGLLADCEVSDWVKVTWIGNALNANNVTTTYAFADVKFSDALTIRSGLFKIPLSKDGLLRPTIGAEEVFISEYSQDPMGALQSNRDIGVMVFGTVLDKMLDYKVFTSNGSLRTVADTAGVTGPVNNAADGNNAKQVGMTLCLKPVTGLYVGVGAAFGDYTTCNNNAPKSASFTAYDLNAGYTFADVLLLSGEFMAVRHKELLPEWNFDNGIINLGVSGPKDAKVHEYIAKAIYSGISDVQLGVRYSVVDPKNIQSEDAAGYSDESKLTFSAGYKICSGALLKAEYSWLSTDRAYLDRYANGVARELNADPDDDIFALQLGLQF